MVTLMVIRVTTTWAIKVRILDGLMGSKGLYHPTLAIGTNHDLPIRTWDLRIRNTEVVNQAFTTGLNKGIISNNDSHLSSTILAFHLLPSPSILARRTSSSSRHISTSIKDRP